MPRGDQRSDRWTIQNCKVFLGIKKKGKKKETCNPNRSVIRNWIIKKLWNYGPYTNACDYLWLYGSQIYYSWWSLHIPYIVIEYNYLFLGQLHIKNDYIARTIPQTYSPNIDDETKFWLWGGIQQSWSAPTIHW